MPAKVLVYCPTWERADKTTAARAETLEAIKALNARKVIIGTVNPFPGYDFRNVTAQYQAAWKAAKKFDALLTVEHDIVPPADAIEKLLEVDAGVVFGLYCLRKTGGVVNFYRWVDGIKQPDMSLSLFPREYEQAQKKSIVRLSGVGWGCTLIRREVMDRIEPRGERDCDLNFATDCIAAGIPMYGRMDVVCAHYQDDEPLKPSIQTEVIAVECLVDFVGWGFRHTSHYRAGKQYKMPLKYFDQYRRAGYVKEI